MLLGRLEFSVHVQVRHLFWGHGHMDVSVNSWIRCSLISQVIALWKEGECNVVTSEVCLLSEQQESRERFVLGCMPDVWLWQTLGTTSCRYKVPSVSHSWLLWEAPSYRFVVFLWLWPIWRTYQVMNSWPYVQKSWCWNLVGDFGSWTSNGHDSDLFAHWNKLRNPEGT